MVQVCSLLLHTVSRRAIFLIRGAETHGPDGPRARRHLELLGACVGGVDHDGEGEEEGQEGRNDTNSDVKQKFTKEIDVLGMGFVFA